MAGFGSARPPRPRADPARSPGGCLDATTGNTNKTRRRVRVLLESLAPAGGRNRRDRMWWRRYRRGCAGDYQRRIAASTSATATNGATARASPHARRMRSVICLQAPHFASRLETGSAAPPYERPMTESMHRKSYPDQDYRRRRPQRTAPWGSRPPRPHLPIDGPNVPFAAHPRLISVRRHTAGARKPPAILGR